MAKKDTAKLPYALKPPRKHKGKVRTGNTEWDTVEELTNLDVFWHHMKAIFGNNVPH